MLAVRKKTIASPTTDLDATPGSSTEKSAYTEVAHSVTQHITNGSIMPHSQPDSAQALLDKIQTRQANVAIIGLGYVGLPLAVAFAEAGFPVTGIDVDQKRVNLLNGGHSPIADVASETLVELLANVPAGQSAVSQSAAGQSAAGPRANGHHDLHKANDTREADPQLGSFRATSDYDVLFDMDAVIICVPTPLSSTKDPDMSYIITAADEIAQRLHRGMLIVLESTTYPGTTEEIVLPRLQRVKVDRAALDVGRDFFLAFSPERIDPGRKDWTVRTTPKVIGGTTPTCLNVSQTLYECAIQHIVPVSQTATAEMVKLLENTFRAVNIAMINEVAIMCDRLGVDVWEVIEAAKTKPFGYMPFYPGPGLGGHCIPIDPRYLAWKMKTLNYNARFIQLAEEINFGMPHYVCNKVIEALNDEGKSLKGARILLLGVAYKPDMGDLRESPALDIIDLLLQKGAIVEYHDPYVPRIVHNGRAIGSLGLTEEVAGRADCVIVTTAHSSIDWQWLVHSTRLIVDTRNVTANLGNGSARIVKL
ncbi:MAG: nucleotide sugar dehydrogenase [Litorilinea sp.]